MRFYLFGGTAAFLLLWGTVGSLSAQVVQLPTYRYFAVGTTVVVPDRGHVTLGGNTTARSASTRRGRPGIGPFAQQRGWGREWGTSQSSVSVTIIDHRQWDAAVLAEAERRRTPAPSLSATEQRARYLSRHVAGRAKGR